MQQLSNLTKTYKVNKGERKYYIKRKNIAFIENFCQLLEMKHYWETNPENEERNF